LMIAEDSAGTGSYATPARPGGGCDKPLPDVAAVRSA
jgi:hypothetical protein